MAEPSPSRAGVVALLTTALLLPLGGLSLVLAVPGTDLLWEHHPAHFWLVLSSAAVAAVLAYTTGAAAVLRGDARVLAVSLTCSVLRRVPRAARPRHSRRAARRPQAHLLLGLG